MLYNILVGLYINVKTNQVCYSYFVIVHLGCTMLCAHTICADSMLVTVVVRRCICKNREWDVVMYLAHCI